MSRPRATPTSPRPAATFRSWPTAACAAAASSPRRSPAGADVADARVPAGPRRGGARAGHELGHGRPVADAAARDADQGRDASGRSSGSCSARRTSPTDRRTSSAPCASRWPRSAPGRSARCSASRWSTRRRPRPKASPGSGADDMTTSPRTTSRPPERPTRRSGPLLAVMVAAILAAVVAACSSTSAQAGWTFGPTLAPPSASAGASGAAPSSAASTAPVASPGPS